MLNMCRTKVSSSKWMVGCSLRSLVARRPSPRHEDLSPVEAAGCTGSSSRLQPTPCVVQELRKEGSYFGGGWKVRAKMPLMAYEKEKDKAGGRRRRCCLVNQSFGS